MFKTIFGKQFAAFISTILLCFSILGVAMSGLFKNYLYDQKASILEQQAKRIAGVTTLYNYWEIVNDFAFSPELKSNIETLLEDLKSYLDVSLIITNKDLVPRVATSDILDNVNLYDFNFGTEELSPVLRGEKVTLEGNLYGVFKQDVLTVAYPIVIENEVVGSIIISTSMDELSKNVDDVVRLTLLCLIIAALISGVLIYISSKTISKPIYEINEAAKVIANGNFDRRLVVKSQDEVGQLADSFNNMAESLHKQETYRREFISNISHDLRSPLTSIKGFLQAMIDGTVPPEKADRYLNIILEETDRLSKLANDVLDINYVDYSQIELNITKFDLNELIRKTIITFETRIIEKQMEMKVLFANEKTLVMADEGKIKRVIYNLVDNAVKFCPEKAKIIIETTIKGDKVIISIKDTGEGIKQEDQKRIFDRFYKADTSRGKDRKGSGLGLAIVKEFINAHGEDIKLISEKGKGSEFIFDLKTVKE